MVRFASWGGQAGTSGVLGTLTLLSAHPSPLPYSSDGGGGPREAGCLPAAPGAGRRRGAAQPARGGPALQRGQTGPLAGELTSHGFQPTPDEAEKKTQLFWGL